MVKVVDYSWVLPENINDRLDSLPYKQIYVDNLNRLKKHKTQKLFKICNSVKCGPFGSTVLAETYSNEGVLYIRPVNISNNFFDDGDLVFLDRLDVRGKNLDIFTNNDLFFGRVGNPCVSKVSKEYSEITVSPNIIGVKVGDKIDSDYLWIFLSSKYGIFQIERMLKTVAQPTTSTETIKELDVLVPSPEIQKYIGDKVRKAEELREEAKRLKKEAEEILNAELKLSYFNERVKDAPKMYNWIYGESIEVRIDSQYYINETNFINNEMYKKGLKLKRISEIANVGKGFSYTSLDNKSIPYIRISDLDDLLINFDTVELVDEKTYLEKKSSQLEQCDLIFAITGATIGKVSLFYTSKHSKATLSSDTAFVRLQDKNDAAYVLLYLKSFIGQLGILKGVTGATNRHLSLEHIGDIFIPVIDNKLKREINMRVIKAIDNVYLSKQLIQEAKQDVEDLIEGNFDTSKVRANS